MSVAIGLFIGFFIVGPVLCWLLGIFNPIGYMGYRPWDPLVKAVREKKRREHERALDIDPKGGPQ